MANMPLVGNALILENMGLKVLPIKSKETYNWLLENIMPSIKYNKMRLAYFLIQHLSVLLLMVSHHLIAFVSVCGEEHKDKVIELNLCLQDNHRNQSSYLISQSLKLLEKLKIVVSYADTSKGHVGYVYQATNFIYTGMSASEQNGELGSNCILRR